MTALVPLNNADALPRLRDAGVGQVYVGFHDDEWDRRFPGAELNRMSGFGTEANPFDFWEMCSHIARARSLGIDAFVCFNAQRYSPEQLDYIAQAFLPGIAEAGGRGVILSDQGLIARARSLGLDAVISTVAGAFNARLAAHYRDRGATRLILPRDLSIDEITAIVRAVPEVEYEVFLMRNGCMFSDSHCAGCHRAGNPSLCLSLRNGETWLRPVLQEASGLPPIESDVDTFIDRAWHNEELLNVHYHRRTCGLCALWRFERLDISAYKVVGRGDDVDDLVADATLVVRNAAIARASANEQDYFDRMELPREPETLCGMRGLSCYYPEHTRLT